MTSFVARDDELRLVDTLRATARLVTVVGPAGVGKTRLAVEYAANRPAPVWLVRLSDARSADQVPTTTAAAVGVAEVGAGTTALVARTIADREALLVLDNCEHVVDAAAELTLRLLEDCPRLQVLATSRRPLDIAGEHIVAVSPLPVREKDGTDGAAVRLLLDRVRTARRSWVPSPTELDAARRITTMLDGLPLAIELAAARERAFGLVALAEHLRDGLHVLGAPQRGSLTAHTSLTAAIAWSIDQLDPPERALLLRLWPFEGGFTTAAAAAIGRDNPEDSQYQPAVLASLAALVDRSMIAADIAPGGVRHRLLETVRSHCRALDPNPAATRETHAAWVWAFTTEQTDRLTADVAVQDFRPLRAELPNIITAISHDVTHQPVRALRVCAAMEYAWSSLGVQAEGLRLIRAALDACPDAPPLDRARALLALSIGALHAGDPAQTVRWANSALDLLDDPHDNDHVLTRLNALTYRGGGASELGDPQLLRDTVTQFATESTRGDTPEWIRSNALLNKAGLALLEGQWTAAETTLDSARDLATGCGFVWAAGTADLMLARGLLARPGTSPRDVRRATSVLHRALAVFQSQDNLIDVLGVLHTGVHALLRLGHTASAITLHAAVAEHAGRLGTTLDRLTRLAGRRATRALADAQAGLDTAQLEHTGRGLDWPATVTFFQTTLDQSTDHLRPAR